MEAKGERERERERKGRNRNKMKRRLTFPYSARKILWITINPDIFFNFIFLYGGLIRTFFLILYFYIVDYGHFVYFMVDYRHFIYFIFLYGRRLIQSFFLILYIFYIFMWWITVNPDIFF